jgi:hypothetical protein
MTTFVTTYVCYNTEVLPYFWKHSPPFKIIHVNQDYDHLGVQSPYLMFEACNVQFYICWFVFVSVLQ